MDRFRQELENFVREVYEGERKVLVFGEGPLHARVMLVGEAPGDRASQPAHGGFRQWADPPHQVSERGPQEEVRGEPGGRAGGVGVQNSREPAP